MFRLGTKFQIPIRVLLVLVALIVAAAIVIDRGTDEFTLQTAIGQTNDTLQKSEDFLHLERANRAFIDLVARTRPAVVQITTKTQRNRSDTSRREQLSPEDEEMFRDFFGDDLFRRFFRERAPIDPNPEHLRGIGSGVIISDDGYILTSNHVIEGSDEITVTLANGKDHPGELIGRDAADTKVSGTDLALLKIDAKGLPTLPFGDSDALEVGEWVIAIGTPLNFSQTVTRGIVSAKGRDEFSGIIKYGDFIQTDAPINRGNSGGALINIRGELVGINTLIATSGLSMGNVGLGFAVPSNMAQQVLPQLVKTGKVERGWLGIGMRPVDFDLAEKLNFDAPRGAFVRGVSKDSPADKAGIRRSDVIIAFNGETIQSPDHLMHVVGAAKVGESVEVTVLRGDNQEKRLTVKLGKRTEDVISKLDAELGDTEDIRSELDGLRQKLDEHKMFVGLHVQNLTPALIEKHGYSADETGVIVTRVKTGSEAEKKGIKPGDLIQEMEYKPIKDLDAYLAAARQVEANREKRVLLYVKSSDREDSGYVTLNLNPSGR